jgi:hypothetical protein
MTNNTINIDIDALTEDFKAHCKIIKLGYEYPGYTGTENYAIVTDLSYAQIMERYAPVAEHYCPFLLLSKAAGEVIADFKRNEDKFSKRMQKDDCYGFEDGTTELYNTEICVPDFTEELYGEKMDNRIVWAAFVRLTPTQKRYVNQHLFGGKTFTQIARDEGKAIKTVQESYSAAIKKLKKFLKTPSNLDC